MGVCFGKWKFVFENRSLKSKIGVENQNLLSKIDCTRLSTHVTYTQYTCTDY